MSSINQNPAQIATTVAAQRARLDTQPYNDMLAPGAEFTFVSYQEVIPKFKAERFEVMQQGLPFWFVTYMKVLQPSDTLELLSIARWAALNGFNHRYGVYSVQNSSNSIVIFAIEVEQRPAPELGVDNEALEGNLQSIVNITKRRLQAQGQSRRSGKTSSSSSRR